MMDLSSIPIREISTCAILLPLGFAAYKFKTGDLKVRLFFLFLLLGALVDGLGWYIYGNELQKLYIYHTLFQFAYLFFEALFFVWLCTELLIHQKVKLFRKSFFVLIG